jgi:hypothetical protein
MKKSKLPSLESVWTQSGLNDFLYKGGKYNSYFAPFCTYPLSSPVFGKGKFSDKDIEELETFFKLKRKGQGPFVLFEGHQEQRKLVSRGYKITNLKVCYFTKFPKDAQLPSGYSVTNMKFSGSKAKKIYQEVACSVFGLDEKFVLSFLKLTKKMSPVNNLIAIKNRKGQFVAVAGVIIVGNICFLHSASILTKYRGKGLSKVLLKERMLIGDAHGSTSFMCTSSNERVLKMSGSKSGLQYFYA